MAKKIHELTTLAEVSDASAQWFPTGTTTATEKFSLLQIARECQPVEKFKVVLDDVQAIGSNNHDIVWDSANYDYGAQWSGLPGTPIETFEVGSASIEKVYEFHAFAQIAETSVDKVGMLAILYSDDAGSTWDTIDGIDTVVIGDVGSFSISCKRTFKLAASTSYVFKVQIMNMNTYDLAVGSFFEGKLIHADLSGV